RHLVDACENKTGHRGVIDLVEIDNELLVETCQRLNGSLTAHQSGVFVALKKEGIGRRLITLLRDVSHQVLKDVMNGDDAVKAAIIVTNTCHIPVYVLEVIKHLLSPQGIGHDDWLHDESLDLERFAIIETQEQVAHGDGPDELIDGAVTGKNLAVPGL